MNLHPAIKILALANGHDVALSRFLSGRIRNQDAARGMTAALVPFQHSRS